MQIVNNRDARERAQPALNSGAVHFSRHAVQVQMKCRAEEIEGGPADQKAYGDRSHGIDDQPTRPENNERGSDNADKDGDALASTARIVVRPSP
jgi:hypothetical protein